jgi:glucokinase
VVFSAAWPDAAPINLDPLIEQAAPRPVIAHNDVLALAARWLLLHNDTPRADHLLVTLGDGELGAALLVEGRPTGDGLAGANELGHMRLDVPTPRCYCGHTGCLERICSTDYLRQLQSDMPSLAELVGQQGEPPEPLADLLDRVSRGLANAINFSRVSSVSLAGRFGGTAMPFLDALARRTREQVLRVLRDRCVIDCWDLQGVRSSTVAAALGMAHVYLPGW